MKIHGLVSVLILVAGCISTRPPTIDTMGPSGKSFASPSPYDNLDSLVESEMARSTESSAPNDYEFSVSLLSQLQLGMGKQNVQIQLGSPNEVEIAGQPKYGNERWTYEETFATANGYMTATKYIYFENHRVVGWEVD